MRRREIVGLPGRVMRRDRKSTRLNSSHSQISYAVFCLKNKRDVEQRAAAAHGQDIIGDLLDDLRPRAVVLVNAVAESHQAQLTPSDAPDAFANPVNRPS